MASGGAIWVVIKNQQKKHSQPVTLSTAEVLECMSFHHVSINLDEARLEDSLQGRNLTAKVGIVGYTEQDMDTQGYRPRTRMLDSWSTRLPPAESRTEPTVEVEAKRESTCTDDEQDACCLDDFGIEDVSTAAGSSDLEGEAHRPRIIFDNNRRTFQYNKDLTKMLGFVLLEPRGSMLPLRLLPLRTVAVGGISHADLRTKLCPPKGEASMVLAVPLFDKRGRGRLVGELCCTARWRISGLGARGSSPSSRG